MPHDDMRSARETLADARRRMAVDWSIRDPRTPWTGNRKDRRAQWAHWRRQAKRVTVTVSYPAT